MATNDFFNEQEADILDLIVEFERHFEVQSWVVSDLPFWPVLRLALTREWLQTNEKLSSRSAPYNIVAERITSKFLSISDLIVKAFRPSSVSAAISISCRRIFRFSRVNDLAYTGFFSDDISREWSLSGYYHRFFDSLIDLGVLDESTVAHFETFSHGRFPTYRPCLDITGLQALSSLKALLKSVLVGVRIDSNIPFDHIRDWCSGRGLSCHSIRLSQIQRRYFLLDGYRKLYIDLIISFRLERVFKICWYGLDGMALAWACHDSSICCIDIQHGLAGSNNHRAYAKWTKIPPKGYSLIPSCFWTWNYKDAQAIKEWGVSDLYTTRVLGGSPWATLAKQKMGSSWYANLFLLPKRLLKWQNSGKPTIIVSLQSFDIPDAIFKAISLSGDSFQWAIRAHPNSLYCLDKFSSLFSGYSNVDILDSSRSPLYPLLAASSAHVTGWSSVFYDAANVGLRTIFVSDLAREYFRSEIESGYALMAFNAIELIEKLSVLTGSQDRLANPMPIESENEFG